MTASEANRERLRRILLHAAQVQDGLIPADSPDEFTVPQPEDDKGLPWWFGPDYHPTDEALAEFAEPVPRPEKSEPPSDQAD